MKHGSALALVHPALLAACTAAAAPEPPAPVPVRPANSAIVRGVVTAPDGAPVPDAAVRVGWAVSERADAAGCAWSGERAAVVGTRTDERGRYRVVLQGPVGPAFTGCVDVAVDAPLPGAVADLPPARSVRFGSGAATDSLRIDIRLSRAAPLPPARAQDTSSTRRPDPRPGRLRPDAPPAGRRIAEWQRRRPGEPLPASVSFARLLPDDEVRALLGRHGVRPYAASLRVGDLGGEHRVPLEHAGPAVIAGARATAEVTVQQSICGALARIDSWSIERPAGWPEPRVLSHARTVLARYDAARLALPRVRAGEPVIYGVEFVGAPAALETLRTDARVVAVEPAAIVEIRGVERVVVPPPVVPPGHDGPAPVPTELERLADAALLERIRAAAAAPRPPCNGAPRVPVDTVPARRPDAAEPTPLIPPYVLAVFDLAASATGTFRPGEPVDISARLAARAVVDSAQLTVALPELADARATGWDESFRRREIGVRYPALDSVITPARPGAPVLLRSRVVFDAPGWYMVSLVARARTRPVTDQPVPTADEAFRSFWIWIDEAGGFAAAGMDPTRYPLGADMQGGPVRAPARGDNLRALVEAARTAPATRTTLIGTVRGTGGEPIAGARVTGRAYMRQCPGRGAAETVVHTDAQGRYTLPLGAWQEESFEACVAVHVDPPPGVQLQPRSVQTTVRFLPEPAAAVPLDVVLERAPAGVVPDPAAALTLPAPVRARQRASGYRAIVDTITADITGDGTRDRIEVSADAQTDARGRPIWEDGHRWRVIVRAGAFGDFVISDEFVPNGRVTVRVARRTVDAAGSLPALVVDVHAPDGAGSRRLRFDPAARAFVTEAIVRAGG